ncbi:MAG TPA: hypothetical protein VK041_10995 [Opitutales bacterium]|nr:hypothetical protein [Opitutales bacterium]
MKSAYELAMERLQKSDPDAVTELTEEQKKELAEIDAIYKAKIAEREVFLQSKRQEAEANNDAASAEQIRQQIVSERERLEIERDEKKNAVRAKK